MNEYTVITFLLTIPIWILGVVAIYSIKPKEKLGYFERGGIAFLSALLFMPLWLGIAIMTPPVVIALYFCVIIFFLVSALFSVGIFLKDKLVN